MPRLRSVYPVNSQGIFDSLPLGNVTHPAIAQFKTNTGIFKKENSLKFASKELILADIEDATLKTSSNIRIHANTVTINQFTANSASISRIEHIANLPGGPVPFEISSISYCDAMGSIIDEIALDEGGGFIRVTGTGFSKTVSAFFGQHAAQSVSLSTISTLIIGVPPGMEIGLYDLKLKRSDGAIAFSPNSVKISIVPDISLKNNELPTAYQFEEYATSLKIIRDSDVVVSTASLPPGLVVTSSGNVVGTVIDELYDAVFTVDFDLIDQENQKNTESVLLPYKKRHLAQTMFENDATRRICFAKDSDLAVIQNGFYVNVFAADNYYWKLQAEIPAIFYPHFLCASPDGTHFIRGRTATGGTHRIERYDYDDFARTYILTSTMDLQEYVPFSSTDAIQLWKNPVVSNSSIAFIPQQNSVLIIDNNNVTRIEPPSSQQLFGQFISASDNGEIFITSDSTSGSSVFGKGQIFVYKQNSPTWTNTQIIEHPQQTIGINIAISGDGKYIFTATLQKSILVYRFNGTEFVEYMEIQDAFETPETHLEVNYNGTCAVTSTTYIRIDILNKIYSTYTTNRKCTVQGTRVEINNSGELLLGLDDSGATFISHYVSTVDKLFEL